METINYLLFAYINGLSGTSLLLDNLAIISAEYMPIVFLAILSYYWFLKEKEEKKIVLLSIYSIGISLCLNFVITLFYFHPRPFMIPVGHLLIPHPPETSFPSDHATFMFSIALTLLYVGRRASGITLLLLSFIGGFARVYCGVHFPFDILGSFMVSYLSSSIIYYKREKLLPLNHFVLNAWGILLKKLYKFAKLPPST